MKIINNPASSLKVIYNRRQNTVDCQSTDECPNDFKLSNRKQTSQLDVLPTLENLNKNTEDFQPSEVYNRRQNTEDFQPSEVYGSAVAVDAVLFTIEHEELKVLLIKVTNGPYEGKWALPGGLVQLNESLDDAAKRVLFQKTNIGDIHLEQLYSFGDINRDVRGRVISVSYFALVNNKNNFKLKTTAYYSEIAWWSVKKISEMAFDHKEIIKLAYERLKSKLEYTNIVYSLLPKEFTLTDLQKTYEIILGQKIDKRNFRKRMTALKLVKNTGKVLKGEAHRPAELYQFSKRGIIIF